LLKSFLANPRAPIIIDKFGSIAYVKKY